ncbi:helix-turn-helix domain-containing protein [Bacillus lacus]|uniref:Helix-turn-helix domain-containing protein n=1 Tax=Metabacillus lacus TaxID=1983721 RepID=A0A7X2J0R8_9BACI|nr:AraC family transcriptional regulator [Metabacillus lacus]MRX73240.1 helix-turn-helix domain-containing protein [Metabacillus lacus]
MIDQLVKTSKFTLHEGRGEHVNSHSEYSLLYISAGSGHLEMADKRTRLREGEGKWVTGKAFLFPGSAQPLQGYVLSWQGDVPALESLTALAGVPLSSCPPAKTTPYWEEMLRKSGAGDICHSCSFQAALWALLAMLTASPQISDMEEVLDYMERDMTAPSSVAELAERFGMTPTSFSRAFKKKTGMSPKDYMNNVRIAAAKTMLLQEKDITAKEVAYRIGLQDEFYFSRLFKKREGTPPSVFMKRAQPRIAVVSQLFLQDHLLSLGIQPVAAPAYPSIYPGGKGLPGHLAEHMEGSLLLNAERAFCLKQVAGTSPDLVIKTDAHLEREQSPVWSHRNEVYTMPFHTSWKGYLREISILTGRKEKVAEIEFEIEALERKLKNRLLHQKQREGWAVIWARRDELRLYGTRNHALLELLFDGLGLQPAENLPEETYKAVSIEELASINPENILFLWSNESDILKAGNHLLWKEISAVRNGNLYMPSSHCWDPWGPLGRKVMIRDLEQYFQGRELLKV